MTLFARRDGVTRTPFFGTVPMAVLLRVWLGLP